MRRLSLDTFPRPHDLSDRSDPAVLYVRSYLLLRTVVGLIGMLLPVALIAGESWARGGGLHVGGSLSSYYHTSMRDVFVGALCVIAVLLASYLAGQPWTWDFWLSLGAGVALLGVVVFPMGTPGIPPGAPPCGSMPTPAECSPLVRLLGEARTEQIHLVAAGGCFLLLAALSFLFARRERVHGGHRAAAWFHGRCGVVILLGIAAAGLGDYRDIDLGPFPLLFVGETAAVWAFGASWLLAGRHLWLRLLRPRRGAPAAAPAVPDETEAQQRRVSGGSWASSLPDAGSAPGPDPDSPIQPSGWYRDPYPGDEQYPWSERWFDGYAWTAATRPVAPGPRNGAGPAPNQDVGVAQLCGSSWQQDGRGGPVRADRAIDGAVQLLARCDLARCDDACCTRHSADTVLGAAPVPSQDVPGAAPSPRVAAASPEPTERYEHEGKDERRGRFEVAGIAKRLAASRPRGDGILLGTDGRAGGVPGKPIWYVGVCMWSWRTSTPRDDGSSSVAANLETFIDENGTPVAPARPDAEFRGSYRLMAEALRTRSGQDLSWRSPQHDAAGDDADQWRSGG